jgi:hypothetical protein
MKSYDAVTTKYSHVFDQYDTVFYELLRILIDKEVNRALSPKTPISDLYNVSLGL